jgi:hypothetical protein
MSLVPLDLAIAGEFSLIPVWSLRMQSSVVAESGMLRQ